MIFIFLSSNETSFNFPLSSPFVSMAFSGIGFEGYEKRLEITFSEASDTCGQGLRALSRAQIDSFLDLACCTIVSQLSNKNFDSYVLSESSLFMYPHKIILKTCGTTKLLLSVPRVLELAAALSLSVQSVKYSRGTFIFPSAQPSPYYSFSEEVAVLNGFFGYLKSGGNAHVTSDPSVSNCKWHIYYATEYPELPLPMITLEMCMNGLDRKRATIFFKNSVATSANEMTKLSGISKIIPEMEICDVDFEPCGYSMNGLNGPALSTIHVTPEEGFSYASYEAMGFNPRLLTYRDLVERVLACFAPLEFSVAITILGGGGQVSPWRKKIHMHRYTCGKIIERELPYGGLLVYQTFSSASPRPILHHWERNDLENAGRDDGCKKNRKHYNLRLRGRL